MPKRSRLDPPKASWVAEVEETHGVGEWCLRIHLLAASTHTSVDVQYTSVAPTARGGKRKKKDHISVLKSAAGPSLHQDTLPTPLFGHLNNVTGPPGSQPLPRRKGRQKRKKAALNMAVRIPNPLMSMRNSLLSDSPICLAPPLSEVCGAVCNGIGALCRL
jgi:hypothetical protein